MFKSKNISIDYMRVKDLGIVSNWNNITDSDIELFLNENQEDILSNRWKDFEYNLVWKNGSLSEEEISKTLISHHSQRIAKIVSLIQKGEIFDPISIEETASPIVTDGHHRLRAYEYLKSNNITFFITGTDDFLNAFSE